MRLRIAISLLLLGAVALFFVGTSGNTSAAPSADSRERFSVTDAAGDQVRADVAGSSELGDCQSLVVWLDESAHQIWGRFVELDWKGEPFLVSGEIGAAGPPKVALNLHTKLWLVVWSQPTDGGRDAIRGRYVACAHTEGSVFTIGAPESGAPDDTQPAVAATGETFAVTWRRTFDDGSTQILGANVVGTESRNRAQISDPGSVAEPAIACESRGDCLVAWTRLVDNDHDVVGRYWFPREEVVGEHLLDIAVTENQESYPSVAWNGYYERHAYAVSWTFHGTERLTVKARSVYPTELGKIDTYVVGNPVIDVGLENRLGGQGDLAAQGTGFVAVWATGETQLEHIVSRCIGYDPETRALSNGEVVWVSDKAEVETYPAVAPATRPYALAVWQVASADGSDILGRHVALPCGAVEEPERVALIGQLGGERISIASADTWSVSVWRVIYGDFACTVALVSSEDPSMVDPSLGPGDVVIVRADPDPAGDGCALVVGAADTTLAGGRGFEAFLPVAFTKN